MKLKEANLKTYYANNFLSGDTKRENYNYTKNTNVKHTYRERARELKLKNKTYCCSVEVVFSVLLIFCDFSLLLLVLLMLLLVCELVCRLNTVANQ